MPGAIRLPMSKKSTAGEWTKPADWPNIDNTADNEIQLLVKRNCIGYGFTTTIAGSGTYSIDWGDGTIQTGCTSATLQQHQYEANVTDDYMVVRIYGATGNITRWQVAKHTFCTGTQYPAILQVVFGAKYITSYSNAFFMSGQVECKTLQSCKIASFQSCTSTSQMFSGCYSLESIALPSSWGSVTNIGYMFYQCNSLESITLPDSFGSVTSIGSMFNYCYSLRSVKLPSSWGSISDISSMFQYCYSLRSVKLPSSWGSVTNASFAFASCYSLSSVTLPTSWGSVTNIQSLFQYCYSLKSITFPSSWGNIYTASLAFQNCYSLYSLILPSVMGNAPYISQIATGANNINIIENTEYLGSLTTQVDMTDIFTTRAYDGEIRITSLLSRFKVTGASATEKTLIPSIRLTNQGSLFAGSSPQVDVSYNALDAAALNALFNDLPTLTGKTIKITGNPGSATCNTTIATSKGWTVTN